MAEPAVVTADAVTVKFAVEDSAGTVTEVGTAKAVLVLTRVTTAPPEGAFADRVTVQEAVSPVERLVGEQVRPVNVTSGDSERIAVWEIPLKDAVTVAGAAVETDPAVAVKVALELLADTVTVEGTDSAGLLLDRATEIPPAGAAFERETVQEAV